MARRWYHEVSVEWLKARQTVLTATDVAGLLPEYKRYLKATDKDPGEADKLWPGFAAMWCQKHSTIMLDPSSTEAAARGHIMEPWAVESWNEQIDKRMYHWDDCLISNDIVGFSPDAMSIPQIYNHVAYDVSDDGKWLYHEGTVIIETPNNIVEIKSYEPASHMKAIIEDRMEHKELLQLAMSFVVLPKLEKATMLWFCPGAPISMFIEEYTRDDLKEQVDLINGIVDVFKKQSEFCAAFVNSQNPDLFARCTEEQVYADFMAEQASDNIFMLK